MRSRRSWWRRLGPPPIGPSLSNAEADFGIHTVLLALRSLAKGLSTVPGRKTLVMLTSGFPLTVEYSVGSDRSHRYLQ